MVRQIMKWPGSLLVTPTRNVENIFLIQDLVSEMIETMRFEGGIGLSANQVGSDQSVFVIDNSLLPEENKIGDEEIFVAINPKLVDGLGELVVDEGCLSFPGVFVKVQRCPLIVIKYDTVAGETHEVTCNGMGAIAVQHEMDHLEGITLFDHSTSEVQKKIIRSINEKFSDE